MNFVGKIREISQNTLSKVTKKLILEGKTAKFPKYMNMMPAKHIDLTTFGKEISEYIANSLQGPVL